MMNCADDTHVGDDEVGENNGDGDGDGDGDDPAPQPTDPLDGAGGNPPDSIDPTRGWFAAATLGNGLVHDSRLNLDTTPHQRTYANSTLAKGVAWSKFVGSYRAMTQVGFRPVQLRAEVATAVSGNGTELEIVDQTLYVADDDANYQTEIETYLFGNVPDERNFSQFAPAAHGARPVSIDAFAVDGGQFEVGFSVAWVYDDNPMPWAIVTGQSLASMHSKLDDMAADGFRPISVASRLRGPLREYAAVLVQDSMSDSDWQVTLGLNSALLEPAIQEMWETGFYPIRGTVEHGDPSRINLLWIRRPPGISVQMRMDLTADTFATEDAKWRTLGYHLESSDQYLHDGDIRRFAVWVHYEPYLRWQGTDFAPDDPAWVTRYRMFHDQAIRAMSFATEIDCSGGQPCPDGTSCFECPDDDTVCFHDQVCVESNFRRTLRPSGTLHIFEGDELVLSRAYTFAPAVYSDTPIDAPMKLSDVSESITATAVVREMAQQSIDLTAPFNELAGIEGAPPAMDSVTVLEVLRNLGGFTVNADSYDDHQLIDDSGIGTIPIDAQEMFDYAVAGHLGIEGSDSYWDNGLYELGKSNGFMAYSNPGFSMLGELIHILSGVPYEQYVVENLLAPVGLNQSVFRDPGHRRLARGTTLAGLGAYLLSVDHPYHVKEPQQAAPQGNCQGNPLGWAWNGTDCTSLSGCQCIGADCDELYDNEKDCEATHLSPPFEFQPLPYAPSLGDQSFRWSNNVGPLVPEVPDRASRSRYSGDCFMGGAPLAAGGWHADGVSLGILIRAISQSDILVSNAVSSRLWNPQWWNRKGSSAPNWSFGLGWYVRGNWVAWSGGAEGSMAAVLHDRAHDFTVVFLSNVMGDGLEEFMDPLMTPSNETWNTSAVGTVLPCTDDPDTPASECNALIPPFTAPY